MLEVHRFGRVDWSPSSVLALATSLEGSLVAAYRESGDIEVWRAAAGSVGWAIKVKIPGAKEPSASKLAWCLASKEQPCGRLFSASHDGSLTEWDLNSLKPKAILDCYGGPVWDIAFQPLPNNGHNLQENVIGGGVARKDEDSDEENESDDDGDENSTKPGSSGQDVYADEQQLAVACDDGCVRLFTVTAEDGASFKRAFPRVAGKILSIAWSPNGSKIFAGDSQGFIRCWDTKSYREIYRITAGAGGLVLKDGLSIWSLVALDDNTETVVSGDSTGTTQFWDGRFGTLLQSQTRHKADVLSLAASPSQDSVFAGGKDGQVILFQKSSSSAEKASTSSGSAGPWLYVAGRAPHSNDVKALAVGFIPSNESDEKIEKVLKKQKRMVRDPAQYSHRWQTPGVAMLISGGSDSQLFTYPADSFMAFHPHAVCPSPQLPAMELASGDVPGGRPLLLVQQRMHVDVFEVNRSSGRLGTSPSFSDQAASSHGSLEAKPTNGAVANGVEKPAAAVGKSTVANGTQKKRKQRDRAGGASEAGKSLAHANGVSNGAKAAQGVSTDEEDSLSDKAELKEPSLVARIKSSAAEHLSCSAISPNGTLVAFSCSSKLQLFELERLRGEESQPDLHSKKYRISKRKLPAGLHSAHKLVFSADSVRLISASQRGGITIYNTVDDSLVQLSAPACPTFDLSSASTAESAPPAVTLLVVSKDDRWLAWADSCGHLSVFDLKKNRLHWSVPFFVDCPPTAILFHPTKAELFVATLANQVEVLNIRARDKSDWSKANEGFCPPQLLELPCGISGLSMSPAGEDKLIAYSSRYLCSMDLSKPFVDRDRREGRKEGSRKEGGENGEQSGKRRRKDEPKPVKQERASHGLKVIPAKQHTLFFGHTSGESAILVEKSWNDASKQLPPPFKHHKFGT